MNFTQVRSVRSSTFFYPLDFLSPLVKCGIGCSGQSFLPFFRFPSQIPLGTGEKISEFSFSGQFFLPGLTLRLFKSTGCRRCLLVPLILSPPSLLYLLILGRKQLHGLPLVVLQSSSPPHALPFVLVGLFFDRPHRPKFVPHLRFFL